jgi:hypothetical protein
MQRTLKSRWLFLASGLLALTLGVAVGSGTATADCDYCTTNPEPCGHACGDGSAQISDCQTYHDGDCTSCGGGSFDSSIC